MRARYTDTASREFGDAVDYLLAHAPTIAADFADSIEGALRDLCDNPYSAQETEQLGIRRRYVRRFRYSIFYSVDRRGDELIVRNIRHAARRWP